MGFLYQLWDQYLDPDGTVPYVPYSFVPVGHQGPINMTMNRDFSRRESIMVIPNIDSVLDGHGRDAGPMDRRDMTFVFRVFTDGDNDKARSLLDAQVAPGYPQRLVYMTDSGNLWFTLGFNPKVTQSVTSGHGWGTGGYCDFSVTWRIRPDWRLRYSQASDVWGVNDGIWGTLDGLWGQGYYVPLNALNTFFNVDATGVAGYDLPTIPDTAPTITLNGSFGGDSGILILNYMTTITVPGGAGTDVSRLLLPGPVDYGQSYALNLSAQKFFYLGSPFRPFKPSYQKNYLQIEPGKLNNIQVSGIGANAGSRLDGKIVIDFWKKNP